MHVTAHRSAPGLASRVRRAVVRAACLTVGLGVVAAGGAGVAMQDATPPHDFTAEVAPSTQVARLMERYECSTVGYGDGSSPEGALVRRPTGRVVVVSFEQGWRAHVADGTTQLVAVCLRPPR